MSCDGRCCAVFPLTRSRAELAEDVINVRVRGTGRRYRDADKLAYMALPLADDQARDRARRFGLGELSDNDRWYACRWWDEATRRCTNYAERPHTCRDYPYAGRCGYCGWELPLADRLAWLADPEHPTAVTLPG